MKSRSVRNFHADGDYLKAVDLGLRCNGSTRQAEAHLKWLSLRTEFILKFAWPTVRALATDPLQRGTIIVKYPNSFAQALAQPFFSR